MARRYAGGSRFTQYYVAAKLRTDPVHLAVLALAASERCGRVLDIGGGRGQLGVALLEAGRADQVLGLDWAGGALREAERAAHGLAFQAVHWDISSSIVLPPADTILIIDVLYQLSDALQDALLEQAGAVVPARIVIRTLDSSLGLRSRFTLAAERLGRFWPTAGAHVNPRAISSLQATLAQFGFTTSVEPCWQGTPFANVLLIARRTA